MIYDRLEKIIQGFGVVCIGALFALMSVQVVLRYGFGYTFFFTEEFGRYLLVWATMAGMAIESRRGGHIRVGFLVEHLPDTLRRGWHIAVDVLIFLLFVLLVYTGIASTVFNHGQVSPGMQLPLSIPFAAIPVFFTVAALFVLERLVRYRSRRR